ncbi:tetratricopeptide repeat protein [Sphingomicrobium arenosum]|uniref:tetratricopeptide repeat protein n=1 Tax=Sphingomicrobium arenosum TaxID=2233861 RepID=UPI00223FD313|nr:tetratricopeptide repeat protein [Sphingomicrobium arenosum]
MGEDPIIRTCSLGLGLIASLALGSPALATPLVDNPEEQRELFVAARTADLLGDSDAAATLYARLIAAGPVDAQTEARAASEAIAAGRFDLALSIAQNSSQPDNFNLDLRLLLLADALRERRYRDALAVLSDDEARVQLDFLSPFVRGWIEAMSYRQGTEPRGPAMVAGMADQRPLARQKDEQAAFLYLATGGVDGAVQHIDAALSRAGPREARLRLAFAESLAGLGRPDLAQALLAGEDVILVEARQRLADGKPLGMAVRTPAEGLSELLLAVAIDLAEGRNSALPAGLAQVARFADPSNEGAAIIAGAMLERDGRDERALDLYRSVDESSPLALQAEDSIIQHLIEHDRAPDALRLAQAAHDANPSRAGSWARIGDALAAMDRHEAAADAYAQERARLGNDDWPLLFLEAVSRHEAGDWAMSERLLNQALALSPDQAILLNYLGYSMLEEGGDVELASAYIRKASRLSPDSAAITDSLGWALYKLGDHAGAVEALARAAELAPADPEIHEHYGDALYAAGRRIEARFAWEVARYYAPETAVETRIEDKIAYGLEPANAAP